MKALIASLMLTGCAHSFYTTNMGVTHDDGQPQDQANSEEYYMFRQLAANFDVDSEKLRSALAATWVESADLPEGTWGITEGHLIKISTRIRSDCLRRQTYRHELLHVLGAYVGQPDPRHELSWWILASKPVVCPE